MDICVKCAVLCQSAITCAHYDDIRSTDKYRPTFALCAVQCVDHWCSRRGKPFKYYLSWEPSLWALCATPVHCSYVDIFRAFALLNSKYTVLRKKHPLSFFHMPQRISNFFVVRIYCSLGIFTAFFLPTRRYASAGNSDRNVSVRLSRASIVSKRRTSWFLHYMPSSPKTLLTPNFITKF